MKVRKERRKTGKKEDTKCMINSGTVKIKSPRKTKTKEHNRKLIRKGDETKTDRKLSKSLEE